MIDWFQVFLALLVGIGIGVFYFAGLWFTVQRLSSFRHPAMLAFGSFIFRTAVVLVVIYLVMDGKPERLAALLAGFFAARQFLLLKLRPERSR